ncbi:MAG: hypothetical protein A2Y14_04510 [Verrucomicrobia bacterium GWF2_51_19]|nr:MAG: hypothetical protein A2Y14_04510 [Verrucomicrobia bacterium GWF2_51_19]HCJ12509.1 peptide ABC transporter ATP-binding protein [Opitutae bacterium]
MQLLEVMDLCVRFSMRGEVVSAVSGISFEVAAGETVAIVGESGSGKSVTALSLTRLLPERPACEVDGHVYYRGKDVLTLPQKSLQAIRGKEIAYVFQEPSTSLNPVFTVGYQIAEAVKLHFPEEREVRQCVVKALKEVGIHEAEKRYDAYPHELSGGMLQRVMIAMALACRPKILIADEPTTALDVTIQKQILDLLRRLRERHNMAIVLITHNFSLVQNFADRVLVMFRGKIVEEGSTQAVMEHTKHPYTKALLACIPRLGQKKHRLKTIDYESL